MSSNSGNTGVRLETNGVNPIPEHERYGTPFGLFPVWFSWNVSILGITYGIYVYSLGMSFLQAIVFGVIGYFLSSTLVGILAVGGPRTGLPTLTQTRMAFGFKGNKFPTLFAYISNMGWKVTIITLSATTGADLFAKLFPSLCANADGTYTTTCLVCWFIVVLFLSMSVAVYGYQLIVRVEKYIAVVTSIMTVIFIFMIIPHINFSALGSHESADFITCIGGMVMAMTMVGLGFLNYGGDFCRYLPKNTKAGGIIFWTSLGISLPVAVLLILGVLLADSNPDLTAAAASQPIGALTALLPFWFYVPFCIVIIISLLSAAMTGVYSSGLALMALGLSTSRAVTTALNALIIAFGAFYLLFVSDSFLSTFQAFLAAVSVVLGSMGAIELVDFIRQKRLNWDVSLAQPLGSGGLNYRKGALFSLIAASIIGLGTITSWDPNIAHFVGFLLTEETKQSVFASANVGVIVSMAAGAAIYAIITFVLGKTELPDNYAEKRPKCVR